MITAYRDHAHAIAKGISAPGSNGGTVCKKDRGCSKGKGGSMHMFSAEHRFFGGHVVLLTAIGASGGRHCLCR